MMRDGPHAWCIDVGARLIGEIRLEGLEQVDRRATLAVGILDPAALGNGYGTEAIRLVLAHAFGPMGLHRIDLRVLAYNERAIRCYEKCGFVIEGRERESALVDGAWHDDVMMGILATDVVERTT
jgi:RimJ/RimL family protein N-acetyltransferase